MLKKRNYLLLIAIAIITLASCSNEEFVGKDVEKIPVQTNDELFPICFGSHFKATTRADIIGEDAATLLNNRFIVTGYKGTQSDYVTTAGDAQSNIVFDNYQVLWTANTANSTESNVANWEYANIEKYYNSAADVQTVKFWDNNYPQYDFIAYSLGNNEPAAAATDWDGNNPKAGKIAVSAIDPANMKTAAYSMTGAAADLAGCYIADLVTVKRNDEGYGAEPVTIKFRHLAAKVRLAIYETISGYEVKDMKFYADDVSKTPSTAAILYSANNYFSTSGTYTVSYPTLDIPNNKDNNVAQVTFNGNAQTFGQLGEFPQTTIGQSSTDATYSGNKDNQYFTAILPQEEGSILNLRVDFTLESTDGMHEIIKVYGATAHIPANCTVWKPGYAYTYIFKITKDINGYTDPEHIYPEGLSPITFDAMVVDEMTNEIVHETEFDKKE